MRPRVQIVVVFTVVAIAACGPTPPQAPLRDAQKLDVATSGISAACGEAYQVTAFAGDHRRDLSMLESTAVPAAHKLASVLARNRDWIYQGETVSEIAQSGLSTLRQCGLQRAASVLASATAQR